MPVIADPCAANEDESVAASGTASIAASMFEVVSATVKADSAGASPRVAAMGDGRSVLGSAMLVMAMPGGDAGAPWPLIRPCMARRPANTDRTTTT